MGTLHRCAYAFFSMLVIASSFAQAEQVRFQVDPAKSEVAFVAQAYQLDPTEKGFGQKYDVRGIIKVVSGMMMVDSEMTNSKIDIKIDMKSVTTGNATRDEHLKSEDFFDSANFPEASFRGLKVTAGGENSYKLMGKLTIRGVSENVEFAMTPVKTYQEAGKNRVIYQASTTVDRKIFGILWNNPDHEKNMGYLEKFKSIASDIVKGAKNKGVASDIVKIEVKLDGVQQ